MNVTILQDILHALRQSGQPMCLSELARELDKPAAVLEGMLSTLVGLGHLVCVDPLDPCEACPLQSGCRVLPAPERAYALANRMHRPPNASPHA